MGSSASDEPRVAFDLKFKNSRIVDGDFYVSNTLLEKVTISYNNGEDSSGEQDVTAEAPNGLVQLTGLTTGTTYNLTITAYTVGNVQACTGSASVLISESAENTVNLQCTFSDNFALGNAIYDFVSAVTEESPSAEKISPYVADSFGVFYGYDRDEFIDDLLQDSWFEFGDANVSLVKTEVNVASIDPEGTDSEFKINFSDGSVFREKAVLVKENGTWKLSGNNRKYESDLAAEIYNILPIGYSGGNGTMFSGVSARFTDDKGQVDNIVVSGDAITMPYTFIKESCVDCEGFEIYKPDTPSLPEISANSFIDLYSSGANPSVAEDQIYSIETTYSDSSDDLYEYTVKGFPVDPETVTNDYFITLNDLENFDHMQMIDTGEFSFSLTKPTAYDAERMTFKLVYTLEDNTSGEIERSIPLDGGVFTGDFGQLFETAPLLVSMYFTAYDGTGQLYTTVYELPF